MTEGTRFQSTWPFWPAMVSTQAMPSSMALWASIRPVDHVADGVDAGHRRLEMSIDGDAAVIGQLHAELVEAQPFDERPPADADQHDIGLQGLGRAAFGRLHGQADAGVGRLRLGDLRAAI